MRWEDERYVRLYTRDTVEWEMLCWQARALMPQILRKVDRAGLLELGKHGARGLAKSVKLPLDVVQAGLDGTDEGPGLLSSGSVELRGTLLVIPNFISAQETASSDAQRKRDQRERAMAHARLQELSPPTPTSHDAAPPVTNGHSVPSDPIRAEPPDPPPGEAASPPASSQQELLGVVEEKAPAKTPKASNPGVKAVVQAYQTRWIEIHRPEDGRPPHLDNADRMQAVALVRDYGVELALEYVARFMDDLDPWLFNKRHPLSSIKRQINRYRGTTAGPSQQRRVNGPAAPSSYPGVRKIAIVPRSHA